MTTLRERLIRIGAKTVSHGPYVSFHMAEVAVSRQMFQEILSLIARLLGIATDELTAAQDQMLLRGRKSAAEKLASFLLGLARRADVSDIAEAFQRALGDWIAPVAEPGEGTIPSTILITGANHGGSLHAALPASFVARYRSGTKAGHGRTRWR